MYGAGLAGVTLLTENPWEHKHPMMQRLLHRSGIAPEQFTFGVSSEAGLMDSLQKAGTKVVIACGERALRETLGETDILRWRGRVVPHLALPNVWVVPMFAPSQLMSRRGEDEEDVMRHPPRFHGVWYRDLHLALRVAKQGFLRQPADYLLDPDAQRFQRYVEDYEAQLAADPDGTYLSFDVETAYSINHTDDHADSEFSEDTLEDWQIVRWSFSSTPYTGVSIPNSPTYWPWVQRLLRGPGMKVGWNCAGFDVPVIAMHGLDVLGHIYDAQDAWHLLFSDLPKGLEWATSFHTDALPWKHLSSGSPALYSAIDADVALREFLGIKQALEARGQWELFKRHVVRLMPILARAGKQGNLMDLAKRTEIRTGLIDMRDRLVTEIQQFVPRGLFPRADYLRLPEVLEGTAADVGPSFTPKMPEAVFDREGREWDLVFEPKPDVKVCSHCRAFASNKSEHFKGSVAPIFAEDGLAQLLDKQGKPKTQRVKNPCKDAGGQILPQAAYVPTFHRLEPWNPNSTQQLLDYMRFHGHPLGQNKRDSSKSAADAAHLKLLHKKVGAQFPIYSKTLVVHKVSKTIGTYTPEPDAEGLIHTQFVNSTSTWRLGSRKVPHGTQIQNWGKRKDDVPTTNPEEAAAMKLAQQARKQIIARPGHRLVQIDSASVEAVLQGYFMNDADYMNLASQSIHAWLACRHLGLEFTPANVDLVKAKHAGLYSRMKVTNYLCLDGAHEVLTQNGWVPLAEYKAIDPIAVWDTDKSMRFERPTHFLVKPYKGDVFELSGKSLKAVATPKHAFPGRTDNRGGYTRRLVDDLGPNHRVPFTGRLEGAETVNAQLLQLVCALQADGHILASGSVQWTLRKPRKIERLLALLSNRPYRVVVNGRNTVITVKANKIADVVGRLGGRGGRKTFDEPWLLSLTADLRALFIAELQQWDGDDGREHQQCYRTMNERNADIAHTIAHTVGLQGVRRQAHTTGMWSVSFNSRQETRLRAGQKTTRPFNGYVYCPTVSTGFFLYRYKGVIAVSGNTNFGGGPKLMHDTYPDDFPSVRIAQETQDLLYALLPTLGAYHHATRWEAHTKTYLETPWGYRHDFHDVYKRKPDGSLGLSKDSKRCVAFRPQNSNAGFQKDNLLLTAVSPIDGPPVLDLEWMHANWAHLEEEMRANRTWARYMGTNVSIHDSLCLDVPEALVEKAATDLLTIFTRPIPQMRGLVVGAEVEVGLNWAEMAFKERIIPAPYTAAQTAAGVAVEDRRAA